MAARQASSGAGTRAPYTTSDPAPRGPPSRIDLVLCCADPSLAAVAQTLLSDVLPALADWSGSRHVDVRLHERWPLASPPDPRDRPDPLALLVADPDVFVFAIFGREVTTTDEILLTTAIEARPRDDPRARYLFAYAEQDAEAGTSIPRTWFDRLIGQERNAYAVPSQPTGSQLSAAFIRWLEEGLATARPAPATPPSPPPSTPLPVDENVQFTVYRPHAVRPEIWYPLLAFAHLAERRPGAPANQPDPLDQVKALAQRALGDQAAAYGTPGADSRGGVPREGLLTFVPYVDGVDFNPRSQSFEWREDVHQQSFRLSARRETVGGTVRGQLTVYLGAFILADIDLAFRVEETAPAPPTTDQPHPWFPAQMAVAPAAASSATMGAVTATPYRRVFPSYSHKDLAIVRQAEAYGRALGDVYLRDRVALRSGEQWNERLLELIEEADVFQLFWSHNSMRSDYVRREWEHAVSLRRPAFIRPTYWEVPMPESDHPRLPPEDLAGLHFHGFAELPDEEPRPAASIPSLQPPSEPGHATYASPPSRFQAPATYPSGSQPSSQPTPQASYASPPSWAPPPPASYPIGTQRQGPYPSYGGGYGGQSTGTDLPIEAQRQAPYPSYGGSYGGTDLPLAAPPDRPRAGPRRGRSIALIAGAGLAGLALVILLIFVLSRL